MEVYFSQFCILENPRSRCLAGFSDKYGLLPASMVVPCGWILWRGWMLCSSWTEEMKSKAEFTLVLGSIILFVRFPPWWLNDLLEVALLQTVTLVKLQCLDFEGHSSCVTMSFCLLLIAIPWMNQVNPAGTGWLWIHLWPSSILWWWIVRSQAAQT